MEAIINTLLKAPISTILVIAGLSFLLLALVGQVPGKIEVLPAYRKWAAIVGATLLVLGIALYLPSVSQLDSTAGQPTAPSPTVTSVPSPSSTNIPPDVKTWNPVVIDDFSSEEASSGLGWDTGVITREETFVQHTSFPNKLRWELKFVDDNWIRYDWPGTVSPVDDFYAQVEAEKISGQGDVDYGLVVRFNPSNIGEDDFYYFGVEESTKRYAFRLRFNGEWEDLIAWTPSPAIQTDAVNQLAVRAEGGHFALYINNTLVGEANNTTLGRGRVGLGVEVINKQDVVVEFDNFEVRVPK